MSAIVNGLVTIGYQITHMTGWRTRIKETKTYPTIHTYPSIKLTGDYLSWNAYAYRLCVMPNGDKSQALKSKRDDAENSIW